MNPPLKAWITGKNLLVTCPYEARHVAKSVAGAKWLGRPTFAWRYPATATAAAAVLDAFPTIEAETDVIELAESLSRIQEAKTATDLPPIEGTRMEPWPHQAQAYHFARQLDGAMLAMDMGTGKSKVTIDLISTEAKGDVVILCPKRVIGVWPGEFKKHGHEGAPFTVVPLEKGDTRAKVARAKAALATSRLDGIPVCLVMNYETAWRTPMKEFLLDRKWGYVVLDESHRIKAPGGKASMFCTTLADRAIRRLCLTGTPMPHSPLDIYAQYRFLDKGVFGSSKAKFEGRYAVKGGYQGYQIVDWQNEEEMHKRIHSIACFASSDLLDLPEMMPPMYIDVELSQSVRKVYRELEKEFIAELETGTVTIRNALVKMLRLAQVTGGHIKDDDGNVTQFADRDKLDALVEVVKDIGEKEKLVVFCRFKEDIRMIREALTAIGRVTYELSGDGDDRQAWVDTPFGAVLVVQIQAGGVGIDLTAARYALYYSLGYSNGEYEQSLARVQRPGQRRRVTYIYFLARGTVDEDIMYALAEKKDVVESILHRMKGGEGQSKE